MLKLNLLKVLAFARCPRYQYIYQNGYGPPDGDTLNIKQWKKYMVELPQDEREKITKDLFTITRDPDHDAKLDDRALDEVMKKLLKNYNKWCKYLDRKSSLWTWDFVFLYGGSCKPRILARMYLLYISPCRLSFLHVSDIKLIVRLSFLHVSQDLAKLQDVLRIVQEQVDESKTIKLPIIIENGLLPLNTTPWYIHVTEFEDLKI